MGGVGVIRSGALLGCSSLPCSTSTYARRTEEHRRPRETHAARHLSSFATSLGDRRWMTRWISTSSECHDHYSILGVSKDCTQAEIKAAFYAKSKKLHPDSLPDGEREAATKAFVQLKQSYDVLRRPRDRRLYDMRHEHPSPSGEGMGSGHGHNHHGFYANPSGAYDYGGDWRRFWGQAPPGSPEGERMSETEMRRKSEALWKRVWLWTGIGAAVVLAYNVGYLWQIQHKENELAKLVDSDEIAKCFLRQHEFKGKDVDAVEFAELARVLKGDVDEAYARRAEELRKRNPDEIREEFRWMRAVQDADSIRLIKQRRARQKQEERDRFWRGGDDEKEQ